jgi:alpha-ketoglutarate-dependent taurine dioxygenase
VGLYSVCTGVGGESWFSDGVAAAEKLKALYPEKYEFLKTKKVRFSDLSKVYDLADEKPIITEVEVGGKTETEDHVGGQLEMEKNVRSTLKSSQSSTSSFITQLFFNEGVRCQILNDCAWHEVDRLYDCMITLQELLNSEGLKIEFRLREGDMVIWNNNRITHGRNEFHADDVTHVQVDEQRNETSEGEAPKRVSAERVRHLVGGYCDWDDTLSQMRVLEKKMGMKEKMGMKAGG